MGSNNYNIKGDVSLGGSISLNVPRISWAYNTPDVPGYPGAHTLTLQELLKGGKLPKEVMIRKPDGSYQVDPDKFLALYKSKTQVFPRRFPAVPQNTILKYLNIIHKNPDGSVTLNVNTGKVKEILSKKIPNRVDVHVNGMPVANAMRSFNDTIAGKIRKIVETAASTTKDDIVNTANKVTNNAVKTTRKEVQSLGDHFMDRLSASAAHGLKVGAGTVAGGAAGNILSHVLLGEDGPHTAITLLTAIAGGIATNKLLKKYPNVV